MLRLSEVTFAYNGRPALSDISLSIEVGEFVGLMGPNSSGKSTLLRVMGGELQASKGSVELMGKRLSAWSLSDLARILTVVSSEEFFSFPFTVEQVVGMGRIPYIPRGSRETPQDQAIIETSMQATDVFDLRARAIHQLSSGERQRVLLARALAQEPQVLLLDEPTAHLDMGHAWKFFQLLRDFHQDKKLTVVCALHDLELAKRFCSRVAMMQKGQLYQVGDPADVLQEQTIHDVFGISRKESFMKKSTLAALLFSLSLFSPRSARAVDAAVPVTPVQAADIAMTESTSDVFVTLTRSAYALKDLPFNAQTVKPAVGQAYDAQNVGDVLSRVTSVSVAPQWGLGGSRLAGIRGATSNQTLVLIDGRPVGGVGLSASQDLAEIPQEQIDHIEIVRGGVSALYGPNAIGGVINVITKRATYEGKPVSDIGFEMRSYDNQSYRLNFGSRYGPVDYFFFGNRQVESGFRDNSDARTHNLGGNVGVSMGKAGKLQFDVATYHALAGVPGQQSTNIPPSQYNNSREKAASTPDARQETDSAYLRTSYMLPLPMDSLATLRLFGSQRQVQFEIPSYFVDTDRHEQSKGGEAQFNLPLGLMAGGSFVRDRLDSDDFITPSNHYIARVENWGLFLQDEMKWKMLKLIPSVRHDKHSVAGESTNPRVQLVADATDWLRFSASAARSFRAPTIDDLFTPFTDFGGGYSYVGNPNLKPEKAWTYDAGFQVGSDSTSVRIGYFRSNISNLIQTTPDAASTSINVGEARRQGAEFEVANVATSYFNHSLNYTYLDNKGKPQGFNEFVVLRLSPRHTFNYVASVMPIKGLRIDNTLRYLSTRWEANNEAGTRMDPDLLWGMRFAYALRQLEFFVGVENLADHRYQERSGYPLPGRTAYGGITLRLWG